jgi:hypothetical protein
MVSMGIECRKYRVKDVVRENVREKQIVTKLLLRTGKNPNPPLSNPKNNK